MEEIKVQDLVPFREKDVAKTMEAIDKLKTLSKEYRTSDNLFLLEDVKKRFNAELQYFATLYAKTKSFKGPNHTYLEEVSRRVKSETIDLLVKDGSLKITMANEIYATQPYYMARMSVIVKLREFFIKVEELYNQFNSTLQCIIQSISVASKEFQNSKIASE